jgi:ABC-type multidrug transport system fused ATPase/permease subunit
MLEAFSFGGILLIILYMMKDTNTFTNTLPILSLYIFAGYRLLPAFQQIYASFTSLTFINSSLNKLFDDSKKFKIIKYSKKTKVLDFKKSISLKKIHFNYPNSKKKILKNVSLTIPSKSTVGFIGKTGSGKTTIIDIILGLLEPQKGSILVDGKLIKKNNLKSWQKIIGYVPQNIFLSDQSVSANIAFGLDHNEIDQDKVEKAAKIAQIHDFVLNELPAKYNTEIGERGIRLSGGQRQRIGIARALYLDPKLLILDEGTNALDIKTEKQVMNSLNNLGKDVTVIIITHRLKTLKNCKVVFKLDKGHLISQKNILNEFKKKF